MTAERTMPSPSGLGRVTLGGGILEYTVYGAGEETVLLLHGNGEDHLVFAGLIPALTARQPSSSAWSGESSSAPWKRLYAA